ncbi:Cell wall-associated hydrolase, NlpC family [Geodermatophilus telluris]|uniref:Cell wall-associated hydrolase, NlpC family n=1 Tax=Geodermatophilus telluris TaxID=1190417 RepID=A0A1G6JLM4_9ACTN|nr:C40 family peptidase [Geodermatophilus telluris]SDC19571.1 Cell wall-associated hydrolase, NlpC family [Geodermatophilus telluris]
MAFPRTTVPGTPATTRSRRRAVLALAGVLGLGAGLAATPAAAEEPTSAAAAADLVAARGHELEVVTERFNEARETLAAQQAAAEAAAATLAEAQAAVDTARRQVVGIARSAYTGESMGSLQALMTSADADEFVNRVTLLQGVAGYQNELLGQAVTATDTATAAQAQAAQTAAEAQRLYDDVAAQQADLEHQIADYQADYARLSAEERRAALEAAAAAHAAEDTRASRDEERSEPAATSAPASSSASAETTTAVPAGDSGAASTVVATAMAQRGKPYVWAAAGPGSFDCSGLTQYAYRAAGVSLPHSSSMQSKMGTAVSRAQLQPGDLVFFYSPVSHVGIYIGNGQMVHAPTSGDVVKVASVDSMGGYAGARRLV